MVGSNRDASAHRPAESRESTGGFIAELHGVRGVALALVVLFHVFGQGRVSGGVDVFLFFSGFLLTGSMYRRSVARQPDRVVRHYARTLLRLVPAAAVVLLATTAAVLWLRPLSDQVQDLTEVRASLFYYENLELIWSQLSYGAAGPDTSPLQHFWSLSVQGQFFLLWPLVVVALVSLGRIFGRCWLVATVGVGLLTVAGFALSQVMVLADQPVAYFHTLARVWELSAGGLLALMLLRLRLPGGVAMAAGWGGLALIVASGFIVDGASTFPGPWVLLPLSGAAAVVAGAGAALGPKILLTTRPLVWLADIAYELYLWHWPILIFTLLYLDRETPDLRIGVAVVAASVLAAALTHYGVSKPVLKLRKASPVWVIGLATSLLVVGGAVAYLGTAQAKQSVEAATEVPKSEGNNYPGAEVVRNPGLAKTSYPVPVRPDISAASADNEDPMGSACWQEKSDPPAPIKWCEGPTSADGPRVLLIGSSRALMWHPTVEAVAERNGWNLAASSRGSCPIKLNADKEGCWEWNRLLLNELAENPPAAVVVEGSEVATPGTDPEELDPNRVAAWRQIAMSGVRVFALRAGPRFDEYPSECLARAGITSLLCDVGYASLYSAVSPMKNPPLPEELISEIDLTASFCPNKRCATVIGNVLTARDDRHFSATFARSLAGAFEDSARSVAPMLFKPLPTIGSPSDDDPPTSPAPRERWAVDPESRPKR